MASTSISLFDFPNNDEQSDYMETEPQSFRKITGSVLKVMVLGTIPKYLRELKRELKGSGSHSFYIS